MGVDALTPTSLVSENLIYAVGLLVCWGFWKLHQSVEFTLSIPAKASPLGSDNIQEMITRIFTVQVHSQLKAEFEIKFASISVDTVNHAEGVLSVSIHRPCRYSPDEYAMVTTWTDEAALRAFAGDNWNRAVIPGGMERFIVRCSVQHFESWT